MGRFTLTTVDMKSLLFACLVALAITEPEAKANAEADPLLYYSNHYNYAPSVYSGYNSYPYAYNAYSGLYGRKKREAEPAAEAEADPWYAYNSYQRPYAGYRPYNGYSGYSGYSGYGYSGYRPYGHFGYALNSSKVKSEKDKAGMELDLRDARLDLE